MRLLSGLPISYEIAHCSSLWPVDEIFMCLCTTCSDVMRSLIPRSKTLQKLPLKDYSFRTLTHTTYAKKMEKKSTLITKDARI